MQQKNRKNKSSAIWRAMKLRLSAFSTTIIQGSEFRWWEDLIKEEPENKINYPKRGIYQTIGPFNEGVLTSNIEPFRIDWFFDSILDKEKKSTIGSFYEALDCFLPLMSQWFEHINDIPIRRLAFGAILHMPVENRKKGYEVMSKYLHNITLDIENSSDLFYQINRPRDSKIINDLIINRLTKWQVISLISGQIPLEQTKLGYVPIMEDYSCQLELDINSSNSFKDLIPYKKTKGIFEEFVELGKEISEKGDI